MSRFDDTTVLITGGAKGMGKLIARRCHDEAVGRLVLWDIDGPALDRTAKELRELGCRVDTRVVDLSDPDAIETAAGGIEIDILFNNAGIVVGKPFEEHSASEIERTMRINSLALMHTVRVFLPGMIDRKRGHVVNIASAIGMAPHPNMSVYAASKWAVLGWSESLRIELETAHTGLHVTTVCPSYVDTGMFSGARPPLLTSMLSPETVVDKIVRAVKSNRILVRMPAVVHLLPTMRGLLPARWFDLFAGRGLGIYSSMDRFVGRRTKP